MQLIDFLKDDQQVNDFIAKTSAVKNSLLTGAERGAFAFFLQYLLAQRPGTVLVVEENEHKAQERYSDLAGLFADEQVQLFTLDPTIATQTAVSSPDELSSRIQALNLALSGQSGIIITTPQGLQYKLSDPAAFKKAKRTFQPEDEVELADLAAWLRQSGYKKEALVQRPGEFAMRGDIVDIYPLDREEPVRLEFFGDEVDTVKTFDLASQRSQEDLDQVTISAAIDQVYSPEAILQAGDLLAKDLAAAEKAGKDLSAQLTLAQEALASGELPENRASYVDYLNPKASSLLDYLPKDALLFFNDWKPITDSVEAIDAANQDYLNSQLESGELLPRQTLRLDFGAVLKKDRHHRIFASLFKRSMGRLRFGQHLEWDSREPQQFFGQMPLLHTEVTSYLKGGQTVILQAATEKQAKQMSITFNDFDMHYPLCRAEDLLEGRAQIIVGAMPSGFLLPSRKLVYLTQKELFNKTSQPKRRIKTLENAQRLRNYTELKPGDYVVHVNHGIGRFEGIKTLETDGKKRDYITITYQKGDQLFVPADQLGLVQKYVASEGKAPHINKLGGSEWAKTKRKVQAKVEDIADDLIDLYAKRESEQGFAFSKDNADQRAFEDAFPYQETPDQLQTLREIKADMESPRPMDRLVVGDVGFGKTEVALRAAFKAILDGKQVAFLVPTTILAQQHYETIKDRFQGFPVEVASLSRFQTPAESKKIIAGLKDGSIDLVVGTHRILSKDVGFKDLGLLVIDEEQRFGVKHKEKLKQLKTNIDVLTLTATPIPRTLHMSMVGVRDLSVMETPPQNRYPIQTYVLEQLPGTIKEACEREMQRDGQIFYLHNRVGDIEETVARLEALLPEARIAYAHGQMSEGQLEDILHRFLEREFDILVTTTIIETGIDMPNVNTMIIEDADRYGLSQLYQLRGRIGRSARLAYAYFLYQPNKVLTEVGEKRLDAIRDFTELGAGFKIAMRDLSIRGAGNMLGAKQHGFIDSVGYDLYSQMLADAIKARKGQKQTVKSNSELDLGLEAYIPSSYIADQEQKIEFYKKIKGIASEQELQDIEDELLDRFGDYPEAVENLLSMAGLKAACDLAQVLTMTKQTDKRRKEAKIKVVFSASASKELSGPNIFKALEHVSWKARISMRPDQKMVVLLEVPPQAKRRTMFSELGTFIQAAAKIIQR